MNFKFWNNASVEEPRLLNIPSRSRPQTGEPIKMEQGQDQIERTKQLIETYQRRPKYIRSVEWKEALIYVYSLPPALAKLREEDWTVHTFTLDGSRYRVILSRNLFTCTNPEKSNAKNYTSKIGDEGKTRPPTEPERKLWEF